MAMAMFFMPMKTMEMTACSSSVIHQLPIPT